MSPEINAAAIDVSDEVSHRRNSPAAFVIALGFLVWAAIVFYYAHIGFSVYREDLEHYIDWSYHLSQHTDYASHMPGWPALIFLARMACFHVVPDTVIAQVLCFVAWAVAILLSTSILKRLAPETVTPGVLLFGFFPLIGISVTANPFCDIIAYAVALAALLFAIDKRWLALTITMAAGLLVHQAFYPFYLGLAIVCVVCYRMRVVYVLASGIPFVLYYIHVAIQKHDMNWILDFHEAAHTPKAGQVPIFEGIIGTALRFTVKDDVKAVLLGLACVAAVALSVYSFKARNWLLFALCVPVILASILSPEHVSFVILRLSKFLVFPACCWLMAHPKSLALANKLPILVIGTALLIITQFVWAYYSLFFYGFMQ